MSFTLVSDHALERISQRTKLTCGKVARLIDRKQYVSISKAPGFNREHLLIYSVIDDDYFIAIRDYHVGTIITLWLLEWWSEPVSAEQKQKARTLVDQKAQDSGDDLMNCKIEIRAHFIDLNGNQKLKCLFKVDSGSATSLQDFFTKTPLTEQIESAIAEQFEQDIVIFGITASIKKGKEIWVIR